MKDVQLCASQVPDRTPQGNTAAEQTLTTATSVLKLLPKDTLAAGLLSLEGHAILGSFFPITPQHQTAFLATHIELKSSS